MVIAFIYRLEGQKLVTKGKSVAFFLLEISFQDSGFYILKTADKSSSTLGNPPHDGLRP